MKKIESSNYGKRLKQFRVSNGLSQKDLSKMTGISSNRISEWEGGNGCPNLLFLVGIASNFPDFDFRQFLLGDDDQLSNAVKESPAYYSADKRKTRIVAFIDQFFNESSADELAWFELQLKFNIPPFRAFLENDDE